MLSYTISSNIQKIELNTLYQKISNQVCDNLVVGLTLSLDEKLIVCAEFKQGIIEIFEVLPDFKELLHWLKSISVLGVRFAVFDLKEFYKKIVVEVSNSELQIDSTLEYNSLNGVCTMLAGFIHNSSLSFDLQSQSERLFKHEYLVELAKIFNKFSFTKDMRTVVINLLLAYQYSKEFSSQQLKLWQDIESPLTLVLANIEFRGVHIDRIKLKIVSDELELKANELQQQILSLLDEPNLNLNSPSQLGSILIKHGYKLKISSSGKISTDREILENLESDDEKGVISKILEYRTLTKLFSTYTRSFLSLLDHNDRIHTTYNQVQVTTGRLSSNNPNLQNIPIKNPQYGLLIRSAFSAPKKRLIISADYSQIELRLLAHFSQDPVLIDAFIQNQDIHTRTTSEIFDIPISEVTKTQRRFGKTLNFALIYQQGAQATAKQLGIKTKEASQYIEKYFNRFAKIKPFIENVLESARGNGYVETLFGRRRYFSNLNSDNVVLRKNDERAAFNAVLQGSNADIIKVAMNNFTKTLEYQNLDGFIVLQVHDELVLEVDKEQAETIKNILIKEMEINQPLRVPIKVDAGIGLSWAEAK